MKFRIGPVKITVNVDDIRISPGAVEKYRKKHYDAYANEYIKIARIKALREIAHERGMSPYGLREAKLWVEEHFK